MDNNEKNFNRAGYFFICTVWIQSQLSDLIILKKNPHLVEEFVANPAQIPTVMGQQRIILWQKMFAKIVEEFENLFKNEISAQCSKDLQTIMHLRNAIAHAHVSLGRPYLLYRPDSQPKLDQIVSDLQVIVPSNDVHDPIVLKLNFSDEKIYNQNFDAITRLDQQHLRSIAELIGISHSRVR